MTRMIPKRIYIDREQDASLKNLAKQQGISQSELIRLAIRAYIDNGDNGAEDVSTLRQDADASGSGAWAPFKSRAEWYEDILSERIDRKSVKWQRELEKMETRFYVELLGETETKFDRSSVYDDRINKLSG